MVPTLAALGLAELLALAALGWLPGGLHFPLPGFALFAVAFGVYLGAAAWVRASSGASSVGAVTVIWVVAVLLRLALLPLTPELSDDIYRYLWDGHVQLAGINPYLFAPAAPELAGIRTAFHHLINNPAVPTIYPPLAQVAFLGIAATGSSIVMAKVVWLVCDLATGWVLARTARETGRNEPLVLVLYLWAPLLVVEVAWSGHLEPLGLLMLALAIRWSHQADRGRRGDETERESGGGPSGPAAAVAGVALALSALTKIAPAAALPPLVRRHGWKPLVAFVAAVGLLYLPYAAAGPALFTGLGTYGEHWWFMKGAFGLVEGAVGDPATARTIAAVAVLAVVAWTTMAGFDLERALLWILGAGMILTPTLHPWYVLWMLPMAALRDARPWIVLGGLAFIGYFGWSGFHETGSWAQPALARAALWLPFFALLALDARRAFSMGRGGAA